jgi:hypothetical protein
MSLDPIAPSLSSLLLMGLLLACDGDGGTDLSTLNCPSIHGVWNVSADYGNGLIAHQQWTLSPLQSGCDLHVSAQPTDPTGLLPSEVDGGSRDTRFWLLWSTNQGACRLSSSVEGTITLTHGIPTQLTGTLFWNRSANGQGPCYGGTGQITLQAQPG